MDRGRYRRIAHIASGVLCLVAAGSLRAEPARLVLDPEATRIRFELGATLHTVRGTARLLSGELSFDSAGGPASGRIVVDARSLETGNGRRDANLHADVLESERYPTIVFRPDRVEVRRIEGREADVRIAGRIGIHGDEHQLAMDVRVRAEGERLELDADFPVPFVTWGMRDPSNFLLSVEKVVAVEVRAVGRVSPALR
jgi:polyisoprenoid-binding protein YceI